MRRFVLATTALAALALAGCAKEDGPKTEEQVREEAAGLAKPQAGLYRSSFSIVSLDVPGVPPAQLEQMRKMFAASQQGQEYCLSAAEAEKGFEEAMKKLPQGKCSYDRFNVSGDQLDAQLTCETGQGMKATIGMAGTVTATGSKLKMSVAQSAPAGAPGAMNMVTEVSSERIGDCPGGA